MGGENVVLDKYEIIRRDALWVIRRYGSSHTESKAEDQAARIAEFVRQLDLAESMLDAEGLDLVRVVGMTTKI